MKRFLIPLVALVAGRPDRRATPPIAGAPRLEPLAGVLALGILALVPVVGGIASGAAMIVGLEALGLAMMNASREQRGSVISPTVTAPVVPAPVPA